MYFKHNYLHFTHIVPIILVIFRNTEAISSILGRNPSKESYIAFNLEDESLFRELRIIKLRKNLGNFSNILESCYKDSFYFYL